MAADNTTFNELIHEEFGDGSMSAIDFNGPDARARPEGGPGEDRDVVQVPAVQDLLICGLEGGALA